MTGNVCFGCGTENAEGLQIKSFWEGDSCICEWQSEEKYQGWKNIMNGGIIATLIDCHTMGTAMSHAYRLENRDLKSDPYYGYATGSMEIKYLKPTPNDLIRLEAQVLEVKGRKTTLACQVYSGDTLTVEAKVIAIRVLDSSQNQASNPFAEGQA